MLKWEELSRDEWAAGNEFGYLRVDRGEGYAEYEPEDVTGKFRAYWDWEDAEELGWFDTVDDAKAACETDYDRRVASIAAANGYVKADDYEVIKKRIDKEVIDCIADAHTRVEHLRDEDFDAVARLKGYVKLEPGQVVVDAALYGLAVSMAHKWERHIDALNDSGVGK